MRAFAITFLPYCFLTLAVCYASLFAGVWRSGVFSINFALVALIGRITLCVALGSLCCCCCFKAVLFLLDLKDGLDYFI